MKVKRTKLPYKSLTAFDKNAKQELANLLKLGVEAIFYEILHAPPDADEHLIISELKRSLEVRPPALSEAQTRRDTQRRAHYGAPKDPLYNLPSAIEPLAQLARAEPNQEWFKALFQDTQTQEELDASQKVQQKENNRASAWVQYYQLARAKGLSEDEANRDVRNDFRWKRVEADAESYLEALNSLKEKTHRERQAIRDAKAICNQLLAEDGITYEVNPDPGKLWQEARRGQIEDLKPLVKSILDKPSETEYNDSMIKIPRFNVLIPDGSNSYKIEKALISVTAEMNQRPLRVNAETWARNQATVQRELEAKNELCQQKASFPNFRPHAAADCIREFFEHRKLPIQKTSKSGVPSCDADTLLALQALGDDLAPLVLDARSTQSTISQLNAWQPFAEAGQVQCNWDQFGTPHGRYTADTPNLQNRVTEIRETIEAPEGYKLLSADLGQAEYVTWASLSKDPTLQAAFGEGKDFHTQMFNEIKAEVPDLNLHQADRKSGKEINFALLYLMKAFALAKKLGCDVATATRIMEAYRARSPVAAQYLDDYLKEAQRTGYTSTHFGRIRHMPELTTARNPHLLHELRKTAWHHHNAGTAAEILKIKQANAHRAIREKFTVDQASLGLQMHDELIYVVAEDKLDEVREILTTKFNQEIKGFLPFKNDIRVGNNWLETSK